MEESNVSDVSNEEAGVSQADSEKVILPENYFTIIGDQMFEVFHDYVIIKEDELDTRLILPDNVNVESINTGIVIGVGPGMYTQNGTFIPTVVKRGEHVVFKKNYKLMDFELGGENLVVVAEADIVLHFSKAPDCPRSYEAVDE